MFSLFIRANANLNLRQVNHHSTISLLVVRWPISSSDLDSCDTDRAFYKNKSLHFKFLLIEVERGDDRKLQPIFTSLEVVEWNESEWQRQTSEVRRGQAGRRREEWEEKKVDCAKRPADGRRWVEGRPVRIWLDLGWFDEITTCTWLLYNLLKPSNKIVYIVLVKM